MLTEGTCVLFAVLYVAVFVAGNIDRHGYKLGVNGVCQIAKNGIISDY